MSYRCLLLLATGLLATGIASPQSIPSSLSGYLTLTDAQVQSINQLDSDFSQYSSTQQNLYYQLQSQATGELAKDSPDPGVVGNLYGQMAMISRDYQTQLALVQSKVAALLTTDQVVLVSGLLNVVRLQPLVAEAQCVKMESQFSGYYNLADFLLGYPATTTATTCTPVPFPTALANYLNLSDGQISTIENAIQGNQDYNSRQALKISELQYQIQDLTAAQTIDTATLGADYVAIAQIQRDETTQTGQLSNTVRSVLTDAQQPQLKALDNALAQDFTANAAVSANILVLPPDLQLNCSSNPFYGSTLGFGGTCVQRSSVFYPARSTNPSRVPYN